MTNAHPCTIAIVVATAALLVAPSEAAAYERQWHLGGSLGYSVLLDAGASGFGGGAHLDYGITDAFAFVSRLDLNGYPSADAVVPSAAVGAAYTFDVGLFAFEAGLLAGGADVVSTAAACGSACNLSKVNLEALFGVDRSVGRSLAFGVGLRNRLLLANGPAVNVLGAFAKAEYTWGY